MTGPDSRGPCRRCAEQIAELEARLQFRPWRRTPGRSGEAGIMTITSTGIFIVTARLVDGRALDTVGGESRGRRLAQ